jgi:ATP-dependent RNA helicase SUPV3L1/SUV3
MIEVWRPGRTGERRRVHARQRDRARQIRTEPALGSPSPQPVAPETGAAALAEPKEGDAVTPPTMATDPRAKARRPARQWRPEHRIERPDRQKRERPPIKRFEPREPREKRPDPNSPFAKLAALKAQLEADAKERR